MPRTKRSHRHRHINSEGSSVTHACNYTGTPKCSLHKVNRGYGKILQVRVERMRDIDLLGIKYLTLKQLSLDEYKQWRSTSRRRYPDQVCRSEEGYSHQHDNDSLQKIQSLPKDNDSLQEVDFVEDNDSLHGINSLSDDNDSLQESDPLLEDCKPFLGKRGLQSPTLQEENLNHAREPRLTVRTDLISPTQDEDDAWEKRINIEAYTIADLDPTDFDLPNDTSKGGDKGDGADARCQGIVYCNDCCWGGQCPSHGPLFVVEDRPIPLDVKDFSRAKRTLPSLFTLADSQIPDAGSGVWAREDIPGRTRFGPYEGQILPPELGGSAYSWMIRKMTGEPLQCIDATEPGLANWMRYVNFARDHDEQNLEAFQYNDKVYYITMRTIRQDEELLVWYGDGYGRHIGTAIAGDTLEPEFACSVCSVSFASPALLMKHESSCKRAKSSKELQMAGESASIPAVKVKEEYMEPPASAQEEILITKVKTETSEDPPPAESTVENDVKFGNMMISDVFVDPKNIDDIPDDYVDGNDSQALSNDTQTEMVQVSSEDDSSDDDSSYPSDSEKVPCPDCEKMVRKVALGLHRLTHTGKTPFACNLCKKGFYTMKALSAHQSEHSELRPFACGLCPQRFLRPALLSAHVLAEHAHEANVCRRRRSYACKKCSKVFPLRGLLRAHSKEHRERTFACSNCPKRFMHKGSLTLHERAHNKKRRFTCKECHKVFVGRDQFEEHKRVHEPMKAHVCDVCGKGFSSTTSLKYHKRGHEGKVKARLACLHCGKRFSEARSLAIHLRSHAVANRFPCPICHKLYNRHYVAVHMRVHVQRGDTLMCPFCDDTFSIPSKLTAHVRTHTNTIERRYTCKFCGRTFGKLNALTNHEASHEEAPKLKCAQCDKMCSNKMTLGRHVKYFHVKKDYPCTFKNCSIVFEDEKSRDEHIRSAHTEERPFRCSQCDELFYSVAMLRDHERWKHRTPHLRHIESSSEDESDVQCY